jgi:telomere length regulation protein
MLLSSIPTFEQRNFVYSFLKLVSRDYLSSIVTSEDDSRWWQSDTGLVSAAAGLIKLVFHRDESWKNHLMTWLASSSGAGVGEGIAIRRAVITALATHKSEVETILDKSLRQFGDPLYIRHTPTMQQEGTVLLSRETFSSAKFIQFMLRSSSCRQATSTEWHHCVLR